MIKIFFGTILGIAATIGIWFSPVSLIVFLGTLPMIPENGIAALAFMALITPFIMSLIASSMITSGSIAVQKRRNKK